MDTIDLVFNKIPLESIKIGMCVSYSQTITDSDIKAFSGISGDRNPVHLNDEYAEASRYRKRIAHGMMTASYFSALFGTKIPGEGCVYTAQSLKFKRPVYIGDTVTASVTVTSVDMGKRRVSFKTVCRVDGKIVTTGEAELHVPMSFDKKIIIDKNELSLYKKEIFQLFGSCFNEVMDEKLWEWAYLENPNGSPVVSLYFDKEKLIGHYAVIPIKLLDENGQNIPSVLSMTTMVDSSYRKYGVFVDQANEVYEKSKGLGYQVVVGFPNGKSAPGFKKRLGWTLNEELYVAKLTKSELESVAQDIGLKEVYFDYLDEKNMEWRLSKPGQVYMKVGKNIVKEFNNEFDIVFSYGDFELLDDNKKFNVLLNSDSDIFMDKKQFDYIFGYKMLDTSLKKRDFKIDLIMSDVF